MWEFRDLFIKYLCLNASGTCIVREHVFIVKKNYVFIHKEILMVMTHILLIVKDPITHSTDFPLRNQILVI